MGGSPSVSLSVSTADDVSDVELSPVSDEETQRSTTDLLALLGDVLVVLLFLELLFLLFLVFFFFLGDDSSKAFALQLLADREQASARTGLMYTELLLALTGELMEAASSLLLRMCVQRFPAGTSTQYLLEAIRSRVWYHSL